MTYGWMLLVVAVVGGAIFSITGSQTVESVNGFTGSDVQVDDFGVNSDGGLDLVLRNSASQSVTVNSVNVTDDRVYTEFVGGEEISVGDTRVVELANVSESDGSNDLDVEIDYDVGGLTGLQVSGSITGGLEITESGSSTGGALEGPSASMAVNDSNPDVGEDVEFDASGSSEGDSGIESYSWDFDDGSTATGEAVIHSFDASDSYSVELEVEDENGGVDTASETVDVEEATVSSSGAPSFDTSTGDEDSWVPVSADSGTENGFDYFFDEASDEEYFSEEEGFYVMKYEAKPYNEGSGEFDSSTGEVGEDTGYVPRSVADYKPWRDISFNEGDPENGYGAVQACEALDEETDEYDVHLTTNREWMTVARQVEQTEGNWVDTSDGSDAGVGDSNAGIYRGNTGDSSELDVDSAGPANAESDVTESEDEESKRTLELANGEVVWDLSSNVRQWVDVEEDGTALGDNDDEDWRVTDSGSNTYWDSDLTFVNGFSRNSGGESGNDLKRELGPIDDSWGQTEGTGYLLDDYSSPRAALRGGLWGNGDDAGVFGAFSNNPDISYTFRGFRCSAVPVS